VRSLPSAGIIDRIALESRVHSTTNRCYSSRRLKTMTGVVNGKGKINIVPRNSTPREHGVIKDKSRGSGGEGRGTLLALIARRTEWKAVRSPLRSARLSSLLSSSYRAIVASAATPLV